MTAGERAAVVKALKAGGAKARRGHLRFQVGSLFWYADVRLAGVGARARLALEVGCWTPELPPEPEGGAVDCPVLVDVDLGDDPAGTTRVLLSELSEIGDLAALGAWLERQPEALVDASLRARL